MGLDLFFREDIRNALLAADEASSSMARICDALGGDGEGESAIKLYLWIYLEGYRAALTTVALAFGIAPQAIGLRTFETIGEPTQLSVPKNILERR